MTTVAIPAKNRRFAKPARHYAGVWARYLVLIFWCVTTVFPFVWTILSAFKDNAQIYGRPLALPNPIVWGNYSSAWVGTNIITTGMNSLIYAVATVLLVMCVATPAAFFCAKIAKKIVLLGVWNEMLFAMCVLPNPALRTLNIARISLKGQFISDQGLLSAALVLLIVPAVIIYTLFQEQVVKGLTAGAVKG